MTIKKFLILLLILCTSLLTAQEKAKENFGFFKYGITQSDSAKYKVIFKPFSISAGIGFSYNSKLFLTSVAASFHTHELIHLQFTYNYYKDENKGVHMLNIIPQACINLYGNDYLLFVGIGAGIFGRKEYGAIYFTGDAKLEYRINSRFSVNTETLFYPLLSQTLNLSIYLP